MGKRKAEKIRREDTRKLQKETVNGYCDGCLYKKCRVKFEVEEGLLVGMEGHTEGLFNKGTLCTRGQTLLWTLYNPYRIKSPLKRTNPEKSLDADPGWVEITWEEAFDTTAGKIKEVMDKDPREFVMK